MNSINLYDGITLHKGDCRDIMSTYPDQHFDAVITDPPYGISIKGEKWDTATPHGFQAWAQSWGEEALRGDKTADITNQHLTNIRDDLAAVLDESARP